MTTAQIHFEQVGSELTAVEITRDRRSPVIGALHRALFGLGVVISSYQARPIAHRLVERIVIERADGRRMDDSQSAATKAVVLSLI